MVTLNYNPTTKGSFLNGFFCRHNGPDFQKILGAGNRFFSKLCWFKTKSALKNQLNNFSILLKNNDVVRAVQFDIELPVGFTPTTSNITTTHPKCRFTVSALLSGNTYRIFYYIVYLIYQCTGDEGFKFSSYFESKYKQWNIFLTYSM
jgi:hypothetical protein